MKAVTETLRVDHFNKYLDNLSSENLDKWATWNNLVHGSPNIRLLNQCCDHIREQAYNDAKKQEGYLRECRT